MNGVVDEVCEQFRLSAAAIVSIGAAVAVAAGSGDPERSSATLWNACRSVSRPRLEDLAERIPPLASWDDLVLPEMHKQTLRQLAAQSRQRMRVYEDWGFAIKGRRGLGLSALFSGPSGTGKTLAAEVLARELRLDLYRIDLSAVVSKYIGETEKNLKQVFDAAEGGGVLLLFDEADALFGKRAEVKDSHDRYANIEVGYLLQRMESFQGLAILTTNLKSSLDKAFPAAAALYRRFPVSRCRAAGGDLVTRVSGPDADQGSAAGPPGIAEHDRRQYPQHRPERGVPRRRCRSIGRDAACAAGDAMGGGQDRAAAIGCRDPGVGMRHIEVKIDRLVLRGVDPADRQALVNGLTSELSRVLADPATGIASAASRRIPVLRIGRMQLDAGQAGARRLGGGIARALGKGFKP